MHLTMTPTTFVLLLLAAVLCPGCGERRTAAPVSGTVTLNGTPQEGIFIYFKPDLPPGHDPMKGLSQSYARTDTEGRFTMKFMDVDKDRDGAIVGTHTVTADDERTFGAGMEPDEAGGMRPKKSRVPRNWSVKIEVPSIGISDAHIELGNTGK